jgi:VanZ family protein
MFTVEEEKLGVRSERLKRKARFSVSSPPRNRRRLWRYGPLIIWAALIFIGSSNVLSASNTSTLVRVMRWLIPTADDEKLALLHFLIRKAGHLTEYAILALLAARAFRTSSRELLRSRWFWAAFIFAGAYSLTDEFHQSFVASRTGSIYDVMIDSAGGLIALTILWWWRKKAENRAVA